MGEKISIKQNADIHTEVLGNYRKEDSELTNEDFVEIIMYRFMRDESGNFIDMEYMYHEKSYNSLNGEDITVRRGRPDEGDEIPITYRNLGMKRCKTKVPVSYKTQRRKDVRGNAKLESYGVVRRRREAYQDATVEFIL
ncbi:hypothetical protein C922_05331 [Plasmodium inui San Antonio 1]|uniref:Uncharacterized protein n=1 Tax=Plasmodium inui San Antonio 1 TaxID=1237626 RepID=W7AG57_9APIC|nr:hypothetical protein C922_05331 [Plasmodium inui San Antonio 1]EUD64286.1 hypothetical protein C922_05331 [Plasmodium inui San Antonio 1]